MSCQAILYINAKEKNRITYSLDVSTSGFTVYFRIKKETENSTTPLVEVSATKLTESSTSSTGYWDIDLTSEATLYGDYFYEIELNDGVNPPTFFGSEPLKTKIVKRLAN